MSKIVIAALPLFLAVAQAAGPNLHEQLAEVRAENERLRHEHLAEVASLRSEHGAVVASLRAEVASLHAQLGVKDDKDLELGAESMHMATRRSCPTHCKGKCEIPTKKNGTEFLSSDCVVGQATFKRFSSSVQSVGTPEHPMWKVGKWKRAPKVECPCHAANNGSLDAETALRRITGQVAAAGIPTKVAKRVVDRIERGEWFLMRLSIAVVKMFICWKKSCSSSNPTGLFDTLSLEVEDAWGGGARC